MNLIRIIIFISIIISLSSCTPTMYTWKNYNNILYQHYKNSAEYDKFITDLKETIIAGEKTGKVPPGIYAEYGYALYEKGNYSEAIIYFQKEYDTWPESRIFMAKMISNAKKMEERKSNK